MKNYGIGSFNAFLLALIVYILVLSFFLFRLAQESAIALKYTDIEESFIDVDIGEIEAPTPKEEPKPSPAVQEIKQEPEVVPQEQSPDTTIKAVKTEEVEQEQSNISDLFGNLKDFEDKKTTKVQSSAPPKKQAQPKQSTNFADLFNEVKEKPEVSKGQAQKSEKTGLYDPFRGKIRRFLEDRWRLYEASGNFEVSLDFFVDSNGNFGYTKVSKSFNEEFDAKVEQFLKAQSGKFVAYPPDNKRYDGKAILSDKINVGEL